jgi:predicted transcriptional regulator of viral defense system
MKRPAIHKIRHLLKRPSFTAAQARSRGVSSSLLAYYVTRGLIEKVAYGVYRGVHSERREVPFEWEDLISIAESIPNGRVCLISALALYKLTDEIPRQFWIAIPHSQFAPKRPKAKIVRMRDIATGSTHLTLGTATIRIFDKSERSSTLSASSRQRWPFMLSGAISRAGAESRTW